MFQPLIYCYALSVKNLDKDIDNINNDIKSFKLNFPNLVINYLKEKISQNVNDTLVFKSKNLDLEIYNKDIKILKVKIIYDMGIWKIKYKFTKLYYEGEIDNNNIFINSKIINYLEKNKKQIFLFINNIHINSKTQIKKLQNLLNKKLNKINKISNYYSYFVFNNIKKQISKPPHLLDLFEESSLSILQFREDDPENPKTLLCPEAKHIKCKNFNFNDNDIEFFATPSKYLHPSNVINLIIKRQDIKTSKTFSMSIFQKFLIKLNFDNLYNKYSLKHMFNKKFYYHV